MNHFCKLIVALSFLLVVNSAYSQLGVVKAVTKPGFTIGINAIYAMPQGDLNKQFKYGIGGEVYGGVGWGKTYLIATVGYTSYTGKNIPFFDDAKLTYLPVKVGVKQMFLMKRLFIQGDVGMASTKFSGGTSKSEFAFGIGAGARLAGLELGLYYDNFKVSGSTANSLNAKLGWSFSL